MINKETYIVATINSWNLTNFQNKLGIKNNFYLIKEKKDLTYPRLKKIKPRYVFFPHWSWIIPEKIWSNFECIVFHMTDLPYGRGGTPLQNLIIRGHRKTKISALKVDKGLDTGDIYYKENLSLEGNAVKIYKRASKIVFQKMIPLIVKNKPIPQKQQGRTEIFKRRTPAESKIPNNLTVEKMYDFIRMLDAPGYPKAFMETKKLKIDFSQAQLKNNQLTAKTQIYGK
ncbi:MAG TPA: methionyl-tRNA formyltransferase [Candidatus Jacksonbacteria bacterium]|nr:MAG: Methionyl-tRNA formyltransferase [Parcubacteria group bacterium GW2011_GWC2_44_22]OGY76448.1 MAG: methionyl-tRNA formyltransferase [Candidatus Jacksonbacteria bacterium RIFOXYB2_FULL_44_15]OGY76819.1 MAG: methionyl-tRNA formyltransferase [Candidatus Jacksonbacteria bacterium RIFOXYA2_FULL_43_12]OGY82178.1 MAG: methionyl-tRNA formyltransferase [Candidatus Jacksonbacteria bacterium RIFOXYD2_FULL_43_21]HBH45839.1 methionyl-tRNA formyltransferase [Candidatus Jacksonbacteria bacterium]